MIFNSLCDVRQPVKSSAINESAVNVNAQEIRSDFKTFPLVPTLRLIDVRDQTQRKQQHNQNTKSVLVCQRVGFQILLCIVRNYETIHSTNIRFTPKL